MSEPAAPVEVAPALAADPMAGRFAGEPDLRRRTARGTLVNAAFLVGVNTLALVKGFVVAAIVSVGDYGVWGIVLVALATVLLVKQTAVGSRFVQQEEEDQQLAFQRAFSLELASSLAVFALMAAAVPLLALLYGQDELIAPGLVLALVIPALALQSPLWVFYRQMRFGTQRSLQAVDPLVSFVVTIGLAVAGAGYWSLVIGFVAGAWAGALAAVLASPYPLSLRFDRATLRDYVSFSGPLLVAGLSAALIAQLALLVGERELGLAGAGAIALAATVSAYTDKVDAVVTQTLYPAICAVRERSDLLLESFVKSNRLALMWGVPFGAALALFAPDLVEFGLGDEWEPAVTLLQVFGVAAAVNHIGFNWAAFYQARGETRPVAVVNVIVLAAFCAVAIPLLVSDGLDGFAVGMAVVTGVSLLARWAYLRRLFPGFPLLPYVARALAPSLPAVAAVLLVRAVSDADRSLGIALAELALYVTVTAAATFALERPLLRELAGYLRPVRTAV